MVNDRNEYDVEGCSATRRDGASTKTKSAPSHFDISEEALLAKKINTLNSMQ
jgi:hypothetical protein